MATYLSQRRHALQAAADLLTELNVDQTQPVDVFDAIAEMGLSLVFQPLKTLLGAVVPAGDGGIMLTTYRKAPIQRYTAAHELGHWSLDFKEIAFDTEEDVFHPSTDRERLAQLFASYFLMPPPLVYRVATEQGIQPNRRIEPAQAYLTARDMGVSYEAGVRQLENLRLITKSQCAELLRPNLKDIKTALCQGHAPVDAHADVWPFDPKRRQQHFEVQSADELFFALRENRTTGYQWLRADEVAARDSRTPKPAPAPFSPTHEIGLQALPELRAAGRRPAAVTAALALVPDVGAPSAVVDDEVDGAGYLEPDDRAATLATVADHYMPGWASITTRQARSVRRHIAGVPRVSLPEAVGLALPTPQDGGRNSPSAAPPPPRFAPPVGGAGLRLLALQAQGEGDVSATFHYSSAYNAGVAAADTYTVTVTIHPTPVMQRRHELLDINLDADDVSAIPDPGRQEIDEEDWT